MSSKHVHQDELLRKLASPVEEHGYEHDCDCARCQKRKNSAENFIDLLSQNRDLFDVSCPDEDLLIAYASGDPSLIQEKACEIEQHIQYCRQCKELVEILADVSVEEKAYPIIEKGIRYFKDLNKRALGDASTALNDIKESLISLQPITATASSLRSAMPSSLNQSDIRIYRAYLDDNTQVIIQYSLKDKEGTYSLTIRLLHRTGDTLNDVVMPLMLIDKLDGEIIANDLKAPGFHKFENITAGEYLVLVYTDHIYEVNLSIP